MIKEVKINYNKGGNAFIEMRSIVSAHQVNPETTHIDFVGGAGYDFNVPFEELLKHAKEHNQNQFGENLDRPKPIPDVELDAVNIDSMCFQITIRKFSEPTPLRTESMLIIRTNFEFSERVKNEIAKIEGVEKFSEFMNQRYKNSIYIADMFEAKKVAEAITDKLKNIYKS